MFLVVFKLLDRDDDSFWEGKCIDLSALHRPFHKTESQRKRKLQRSSKLLFIFLEAFKDPFVTAAEAASQSSSGTRANLHKVEAAEEDLL